MRTEGRNTQRYILWIWDQPQPHSETLVSNERKKKKVRNHVRSWIGYAQTGSGIQTLLLFSINTANGAENGAKKGGVLSCCCCCCSFNASGVTAGWCAVSCFCLVGHCLWTAVWLILWRSLWRLVFGHHSHWAGRWRPSPLWNASCENAL